jgi:integrase
MLREHLDRYPPSSKGFVFTAARGGPIRHGNFYRRHFCPAVAGSPLPTELRFHDLRHTCAAILIANGRHLEEVKDHLGHSSIRVTSDRYGHLFPEARTALAESLDETFRLSSAAAQPRPEDWIERGKAAQ